MYDFAEFLKSCIGLSYLEIISKAEQQGAWAESMTRGGKRGAPKARKEGAGEYAAELKSFLFYLRYGTKPGSGSFSMYRPVVRSLVDSGEFRPSALDAFSH